MIHAMIIAGGSGTRFWPESRRQLPKQFLRFEPSRSLIQATAQRLDGLIPQAQRYVVCGKRHAALVTEHLGISGKQLVVEPEAKNTAPAIALGNAAILAADPEAIVCVLPADHFVADEAAFRKALADACELAKKGGIITLGITPTRPDTGFGYIETSEKSTAPQKVVRFVEKPKKEDAERYLASGRFVWNAGIFIFKASTMQAMLREHAPAIFEPLQKAKDDAGVAQAFASMPSISIDYAVMEKAKDLWVIPTSCGWSDVGSWDALSEVRAPDANGNVVAADSVLLDAHRNIVKAPGGKKVCLVGVSDLIVVETADAILVMKRGESQRVRDAVQALEKTAPQLL